MADYCNQKERVFQVISCSWRLQPLHVSEVLFKGKTKGNILFPLEWICTNLWASVLPFNNLMFASKVAAAYEFARSCLLLWKFFPSNYTCIKIIGCLLLTVQCYLFILKDKGQIYMFVTLRQNFSGVFCFLNSCCQEKRMGFTFFFVFVCAENHYFIYIQHDSCCERRQGTELFFSTDLTRPAFHRFTSTKVFLKKKKKQPIKKIYNRKSERNNIAKLEVHQNCSKKCFWQTTKSAVGRLQSDSCHQKWSWSMAGEGSVGDSMKQFFSSKISLTLAEFKTLCWPAKLIPISSCPHLNSGIKGATCHEIQESLHKLVIQVGTGSTAGLYPSSSIHLHPAAAKWECPWIS